MKLLVKLTIVATFFVIGTLTAQDFQGVATYKTKRKVDVELDSTKIESAMQKQIKEMLKKQFEKTYTLTFNKEASIYKEEEALAAPNPAGMDIIVASTGGGDIMYKNSKLKTYTNQNEFFGKIFLIEDELKPIEWELSSETKNIGAYTCFKATITEEIEVVENKVTIYDEKDEEDSQPKTIKKTKVTTAWYTPQVPVNTGPEQFFGLPGLILEINDGSQTIICSKVVLNPEHKIDIKKPEKGKKVSQKEFESIVIKKLEENKERSLQRRSDDGEHIRISIGG